MAEPYEFCQISGPNHAIACNRPFEYGTLPVALQHEAFGIFKDRCKAPPSKRSLLFLDKVAFKACEWYKEETQRRTAIQSAFEELDIRFHVEKVPNTEFTTDGNLVINIMPAAIRECKNHSGHALNQVILCYTRFVLEALSDPQRSFTLDTTFPCILMTDIGISVLRLSTHVLMGYAGPVMGFYGAVWDGDRAKVEPLGPLLDLTAHWMEEGDRGAMASYFDAFVLATENIQAHYESIAEAMAIPPLQLDSRVQNARKYPFLRCYEENGQERRFTYVKRLYENKLVFAATIDQPYSGKCIVKFTSKYSKAAHDHLTSRYMAPRIRNCIRISADWTAVIMDMSLYKVLFDLQLSKVEQDRVKRQVMRIVEILHEGGFVHGDVRDSNILVDPASLVINDVSVHLIDFDWAGRVGEARYPMRVNRMTVKRPAGVEGGELITQQHDIEMVSYLFSD